MADSSNSIFRAVRNAFEKGKSDFSQKKSYLSTAQILPPGGQTGMISQVNPSYWFSPLQPIRPISPTGQRPRQRSILPGENIVWTPGADKEIGFDVLRAFADSWDILRLVIETRKDQLCSLPWEIRVKAKIGEKHKDRKQRQMADPTAKQLNKFFQKPDGQNPWKTWLRMLVEDMLVLDALTVYLERDLQGKIASAHPIDGATVNRLMTDQGLTPTDPTSVAYQQVLYGIPSFDFTINDLLYYMKNPRTHRRYGYSRVEQIMITIAIGIRSQEFNLKYYCYSDDTEVYTKRGWIKFKDATQDDEFATRKKDAGVFEWQKATTFFRKNYRGKMINFKNRSLDLLVTPNHRMLVGYMPQGAKPGRPKKIPSERVVQADLLHEFLKTSKTGVKIPQSSVWEGKEIGKRVFKVKRSASVEMTGDQYCAFMGMFIAEGFTCKDKKGAIGIAQPKGDKRGAHETYRRLLQSILGDKFSSWEKGLDFTRVSLATFLKQFGKAHEKFIPDDIRGATPRQLKIFWDYYYLGDGQALGGAKVTQQCYTVSQKLADQLCEVIQKMGFSVTTLYCPPGKAIIHHKSGEIEDREVNKREAWVITLGKRKSTNLNRSFEVDYDGHVCCVSVPNTFLFVRRNGKTAWCGNTDGNLPEAMCFLPADMSIDRIKEVQQWFDSVYAGDLAKRRRLTFLPGFGTGQNAKPNVVFPKADLIKSPIDEFLINVVCYNFGVSNQGFMKMMNRATAQQAAENAQAEGLKPDADDVMAIANRLIEYLGFSETHEFAWQERREVDPVKAAQTDNLLVGKIYTVNEIREARGDDPSPVPEADMLGMFTQAGFVPLDANEQLARQTKLAPPNADGSASGTDGGPSDDGKKKQKPNGKPVDAIAPGAKKLLRATPSGPLQSTIGFAPTVTTASIVAGFAEVYGLPKPAFEIAGSKKKLQKYSYGTTQVDIPVAIADQLIALGRTFNTEHLGDVKGIELHPHVTVRYGLLDEDHEDLIAALEAFPTFVAVLGRTIAFPSSPNSDGFSPIVIEVFAPELAALHSLVTDVADCKPSDFDYHAHATVAYILPWHAQSYVGLTALEGAAFTVERVEIIGKDGEQVSVALSSLGKIAKYSDDQPRDENGRWSASVGHAGFTMVSTSRITADKELALDQKSVAAYKEKLKSGEPVSAITVVRSGNGYRVLDGNHRLAAAKELGHKKVGVNILFDEHDYEKIRKNAKPTITAGDLTKASRQAAGKVRASLKKKFKLMRASLAAELQKGVIKSALHKVDEEDLIKRLLENLEEFFGEIPAEVGPELEAAFLEGALEGVGQLELEGAGLLAELNPIARDWALSRAAELVGRRRDEDGTLVDNPDARWAISETTRNDIKQIVANAFEAKEISLKDIADQIQESGLFSESRAEMIANVEVGRAQVEGNYQAWKRSGMVKALRWYTSASEGVCEDCEANKGAVVAMGEAFPSGAERPGDDHPGCRCAVVAEEIVEGREEN